MKPFTHVGSRLFCRVRVRNVGVVCATWLALGCTGYVTGKSDSGAGPTPPNNSAGAAGSGGSATVAVSGDHAPLVPVPAAMRRLTARQFTNSVQDIFGSDLTLTRPLEADETNERFASLGAAKVATSPRGVEQYRDAALEVADLVLARKSAYPELASCSATSAGDPCVSAALRHFGERLFRRPLTDAETARYVGVATANGDQQLGVGLRYALGALLQSPSFLYTPEVGEASGATLRYTSYEMATRLAYFLWDSAPDAALLDAAGRNALVDEAGLTEQITRLLGAERAQGLAGRFFGEAWNVNRLTAQSKNAELFPEWTDAVATAARAEFNAFLTDLTATRKADLRELFTGRTGFPSAALTPIYGSLTQSTAPMPLGLGGTRTGLLTSAAVVAANSPTDRTSPTYRGVFVLERVLCVEPPPPPPNVRTELSSDPTLPLRQRLEQHRSDPVCHACHGLFDPLGLTFEGFDAIGRERSTDAGKPVDTSGTLNDVTFAGVKDLAEYLAKDPRTGRCLAHQLNDYATGHDETTGESGAVDSLRDALVTGGYRFDALVTALTRGPDFRYLAKAE